MKRPEETTERQQALDTARGLDPDDDDRADQAREEILDASGRMPREGTGTPDEVRPPREGWEEFCSSFSQAHRGWIVTLREVDTEQLERDPERARREGQVLTQGESLSRVHFKENDGSPRIELEVGEGPEATQHVIERPVRLFGKQTSEGADAGLRVDAEAGRSALLLFRVPARPDELDGIAPAKR